MSEVLARPTVDASTEQQDEAGALDCGVASEIELDGESEGFERDLEFEKDLEDDEGLRDLHDFEGELAEKSDWGL